ncbi:pirin family protein [Adhaeribacter pallidiroseus]|uniref:Quercetin 2,3-dioxygenase C-terminal cupin domain-containing protein n=1 Tax=Adhaeribacter pallidiroseus TaxID=2072847 RepID=A0A369QJ59_9BACT|nr:hypothetical protein [Adhaeribacter pallidiroseus]RDC64340.1 hypothetical protein AHMF7616_02953 [Adhaeribacter pallidiroseus]
MKQIPGKIYLADQRGHWQTPHLQRFSTFNYQDFYQEHKQPYGDLYLVNEETLAGSQNLTYHLDQASHILIIPVTGAVNLSTPANALMPVEVGQVLILTAPAPYSFQLVNPYAQDNICFLQVRLRAKNGIAEVFTNLIPFTLDDPGNPLTEIIPGNSVPNVPDYKFRLSLGRFAGRQEITYPLEDNQQFFFAFVLAGAFEAEGRLLHEKDGLSLWDTPQVELEALSNNAIILILEWPRAEN